MLRTMVYKPENPAFALLKARRGQCPALVHSESLYLISAFTYPCQRHSHPRTLTYDRSQTNYGH